MSEEMKDLATTATSVPAEYNPSTAYGFEETDSKDIVIPRILSASTVRLRKVTS